MPRQMIYLNNQAAQLLAQLTGEDGNKSAILAEGLTLVLQERKTYVQEIAACIDGLLEGSDQRDELVERLGVLLNNETAAQTIAMQLITYHVRHTTS